ncbi:DNA polymerase ligase N-terminal domain-containing protein [Microbacterium sp. 69-10]|uniref:DNA polymerase ligase N-terminal domain-containing protein n=1 Tax=Microbacterium sp. 69-10 TaxID=1895783 RepID=UPI0025E1CDA6|nr:DNA polymerase ligase N-terminal domain-containing protein [Microbacterium sp. 69-10]
MRCHKRQVYRGRKHVARHQHFDLWLENPWPSGQLSVPALAEGNHLAPSTSRTVLLRMWASTGIPAGQYGAGHVEIWDHGSYDLERWSDDEIIVTLHGQVRVGSAGELPGSR